MGLRGAQLAAAIEKAAALDPAVREEFLKLADNSPLKMDAGTSPLSTDSPATAPKLDAKPPAATPPAATPKVVAPTQPAQAAPPKPNNPWNPTQPPAPKLNPSQTPPPGYTPPTPAPIPAGEDKPSAPPGSAPGGGLKPDVNYQGLNDGYAQANTAYQQAHAKWIELHRSKPGTPEEAAAWEALPGLKEKIDQAHQARIPYMGEEYAAAKAEMDAAAKPYDALISQGVPSTDPKYVAAMNAYHAAQAKHQQFVDRGLAVPTPASPGAPKPDPDAADPFAGYGADDQPDPNAYKPGSAPRWSNMFQAEPGKDLHAYGAHQPVKDLYQQWNDPKYRQTVTTGLRDKFLPWMQQTGGAGLEEWTNALDPHQRTTVRLGLSDELVRVQKELTASTAWAKDPNKVKEYESYRPTILDPSKRGMFDGYVKTVTAYKSAEAAWMDRYKQGVDDPTLRAAMVTARQQVDKMGQAGVNDASHHWYQTVKKSGELTAAKQAYQQAYAQINYAEFGSAAPVDLKAGLTAAEQGGATSQVRFREQMRGTERQRAAYLASLDYDTYRKEMEEDAKVEAEAETARRVGPGTTMGGDVAAKWQQSKDKIYNDVLKAKLGAIPDEANFYHGRNLVIQHALQDPNSAVGGVSPHSPKGWEATTTGWFRPKKTERELVKPQVNYPRGGVKEQAVYRDKITDYGQSNPYSSGAQHFYDRYIKSVAGQTEAYAQRAGASSWAAGFAKADETTRAGYADRMSPTDRTMLINDLMRTAQSSAQAGDATGAENARQAAVYLSQRFNKQLEEFKANPHNVNLMNAFKDNGGQWSDRGVPQPIQAHLNSLNPAMRGYVSGIADQKALEYYRGLRQNNDPRYQLKYNPAFGYEWVDRTVLNAGATMAPIYRTGARIGGAVTGDGPGLDYLGGDTAQLKFIMENPDKAHLIDWSGKPGQISNKLEDVVLDAGLTGLTLLPVGLASNAARGTGMMMGGLGGSSAAMAGVEMAPIDQKYKPALRVVAGIAGGMGGGWAGGATVGAGQKAVQAFASTNMVRATTSLAKVEGEVARLTSAGKPIPADLAAKQAALKTELEGMRAAGGDKLVLAENAQKAALERVAALESRMKDASLSPAYRRAMASSPEYKEAVKALRNAEKDLYGVYKGLDAAKAGPASAVKAPAGAADDVASSKPAPGTPGNPYSLDDAVVGSGAAPEAGKGLLQRWGTGWTDRKAWGEGLDRWTKGLSPAEVLKRRKDLLADRGPTSSVLGHTNLSYNIEHGLQHALKYLPEPVSRLGNLAFRTVATPFRAITGEGALRNMALRRPGAATGYGLSGAALPFLGSGAGGHAEGNARLNNLNDFVSKNELSADPEVQKKVEEARKEMAAIKGQKGFVRTGDPKSVIMHQFLPGSWLPIQGATWLHDQFSDNKWRDKDSPNPLVEMNERWKGLKNLGTGVGELPDNPLARERFKDTFGRVLPNAAGDSFTGMRNMMGSGKDAKGELANTEAQLFDLEDKLEALPPDSPERAKLQATLALAKKKREENLGAVDTRGQDAIHRHMALEDQKGDLTAKLEAARQAAAANPADPTLGDKAKLLEGDLKAVEKQLGRTGLTKRDADAMAAYRKEIETARQVAADPKYPPEVKAQARKVFEKYNIDPANPAGMVGSVQNDASGTREFDPATGAFKNKPKPPGEPGGPTGPEPVGDDEVARLESDYGNAVVTGNTAGAKAAYDAALAKAGGDPTRLPLRMFAPPLDHTSFEGMDEAQFGQLIDGGAGGAGTYQRYKGLQAEVVELGQKAQALQQAGQPVPPEMWKAYEDKMKQLHEVNKTVQGRAVEHYEQTVLKQTREKDLPAFQGEYERLMGAMKSRPPGTPMSPEDQDALIALRAKGQDISKKYLDHAMRKAAVVGGFKDDGTPIKSVQDFLGEAEKTKPVLGPDGQPLTQLVRQPDGSVVRQPLTEPASPIGKEIKARIDQYLLAQVGGIETGQVDDQGRPVLDRHVPLEVGAGIFGKMAPMEKMLTFAGLSLGVVGMMGAMFGFGGAWLPILGLLGAGFGASKMTGGDLGKLFKKDFWMDATKSQEQRNGEVLNRFADSTDNVTGASPVGQVRLDSLKGMPQYADMVAGKLPARQAVQYLAALQPQDRAKFQAELQATQPQSPLLPMIRQVDQFHAARQDDLTAEKATGAPPTVPTSPGRPPKPGSAPAAPAGVSKATTLQQFAAENGVKMNGALPDLTGMKPERMGAMVARMSPPLKAEATRQLDAFVIKTVREVSNGAITDYTGAWKAIEGVAAAPSDPNYDMARQAVSMRKMLSK